MKSIRTTLKTAIALISVLVPMVAGAQMRSLNSTRDGQGTLSFRRRSSSNAIRKVSVDLKGNGHAEIRILSGANESFSGKWRNDGNNRVRLDIDRVGRDRASGGGTVNHTGRGEFTSLSVNGNVGGAKFDLSFSAGRHEEKPVWDPKGEFKFTDNAKEAIRGRFPGYSIQFKSSILSSPILGERSVKGEFTANGGHQNRRGRYKYTVVLGAGTANVKSVRFDPIR